MPGKDSVTNEDLAHMIKEGFDQTATKADVAALRKQLDFFRSLETLSLNPRVSRRWSQCKLVAWRYKYRRFMDLGASSFCIGAICVPARITRNFLVYIPKFRIERGKFSLRN